MKTLEFKYRHQNLQWPGFDDLPDQQYFSTAEEVHHALYEQAANEVGASKYSDKWRVEEYCRICDGVHTFVQVKPSLHPTPSLEPIEVKCGICGLHIKEGDRYLAAAHVEPLRQKVVDAFFAKNRKYREEEEA